MTSMEAAMVGGGDPTSFHEADSFEELSLDKPDEFPVDPISSDVATAKELKEEADQGRTRSEEEAEKAEKNDLSSTLMSVVMISGVVIAAVAVGFFVTKKLKST